MKGSFTAPFDGSHGWYWKNNTDDDIAVLLKVKGQFEVIGLKPLHGVGFYQPNGNEGRPGKFCEQ